MVTGMLDALLAGAAALFAWPAILYVFVGVVAGLFFGALPGLGGPVLLALLLPVTFGFASGDAMILLGSALGGVAFGGSVSAILINTPGTPANAATTFDGYPMTQQGRAKEALGIAATASAMGAVLGIVVLVLLIPVARQIILSFGPPEFFWISLLGLFSIALVTKGHFLKGLVSAALGLLITFVGFSGTTGTYRFGFGTTFLFGGIGLIPVLIGLFAVAESVSLTMKTGSIAERRSHDLGGSTLRGVLTVFRNWTVFLRSSFIGVLIGVIPGVGGAVANFIAYSYAVQMSDEPETFGHGNPQGVIASEAANDAKDGGTLLPTVVFGVPGSTTAAIILAGLLLHGLTPGEALLTEDLPVLFTLLLALVMANLLTSLIGLVGAEQLARIAYVRTTLIVPAILVISFVGSFVVQHALVDVFIAALFGLVGYAMIQFDYSRVAMIIAVVLGPIVENSFIRTLQLSRGDYTIFVTRPVSAVLVALVLLTLLLPAVRAIRRRA